MAERSGPSRFAATGDSGRSAKAVSGARQSPALLGDGQPRHAPVHRRPPDPQRPRRTRHVALRPRQSPHHRRALRPVEPAQIVLPPQKIGRRPRTDRPLALQTQNTPRRPRRTNRKVVAVNRQKNRLVTMLVRGHDDPRLRKTRPEKHRLDGPGRLRHLRRDQPVVTLGLVGWKSIKKFGAIRQRPRSLLRPSVARLTGQGPASSARERPACEPLRLKPILRRALEIQLRNSTIRPQRRPLVRWMPRLPGGSGFKPIALQSHIRTAALSARG